MWLATSFDDAIAQAEVEARDYEQDGITYVEFAQAYRTFIEVPVGFEEGQEVFSLLRESELEVDEYLDTFFDTGRERQGRK